MQLTVLERMTAQASLAQEGDITFLRLRNQLIDKLGLSEAEIEEFSVQILPDGQMRWNIEVPQEREIDLSSLEEATIRDALVRLNRSSKLTPKHVTLYEKLVK